MRPRRRRASRLPGRSTVRDDSCRPRRWPAVAAARPTLAGSRTGRSMWWRVVGEVERDLVRGPGSSADDDPRDRSGGLRLEAGEPGENAPFVGAERHTGRLASRQQQVRRAIAQGHGPGAVCGIHRPHCWRSAGVVLVLVRSGFAHHVGHWISNRSIGWGQDPPRCATGDGPVAVKGSFQACRGPARQEPGGCQR